MLKKMLEIVMICLIVVGAAGAYFKWVGALPISVTQTQKMSSFDVTGEGKVVVIPDQAEILLGISEQGSSMEKVTQIVNQKMETLIAQLKAIGIAKEDIKTVAYTAYQDYQQKNLFHVQSSVNVIVRDIEKTSQTLDLVGTIGLDNVSGPTFSISDNLKNKTVKEARELAIDKAKAKAEELAGLAGMKLGRIINIVEGGARPQNFMVRDMAPMAGSNISMEKTAPPVEVGSSEVVVDVTLSYETR